MIALLLALAGCTHPATPPVFAEALPPPIAEDAPPAVVPRPGDVTEAVPLFAGDVAPADGVLVPPTDLDVAVWADEQRVAWRERYRIERTQHEADRAISEHRAAADGETIEQLRAENRALRWAGIGLGAAGLAGGIVVGLVAGATASVLP